MELRNRKVLVVGLGRSGIGAARLCAARNARVTVTDRRDREELGLAVEALGGARVRFELGGHRPELFSEADLVVVSPGVPELPGLRAARRGGVPILGELELAFRFVEAPVVAITGTNGKSTTTALLGAMIAATGRPTFIGGNLGEPLAEAVGTAAAGPDGALVLEVSSFQLETVERFHPRVSMLLNLSEDHLDRYPDYTSYVAAKARIFERQGPLDFAVVNGEEDQAECRHLAARGVAQIVPFRVDGELPVGAWLEGDDLQLRLPSGEVERIPRRMLGLAGRHNLQNALAAILGARLFGADLEACKQALVRFRGLPHRMELVMEHDDVRYYNDSKATNVGSVVGSLTGFERRVILIAGGKDKGGDYQPLLPVVRQVVGAVVLIGAAAERMSQVLGGEVPIHREADLEGAVRRAASLARSGDAVVLSPACSSFDMFRDFEERGEVFAAAVRGLREDG